MSMQSQSQFYPVDEENQEEQLPKRASSKRSRSNRGQSRLSLANWLGFGNSSREGHERTTRLSNRRSFLFSSESNIPEHSEEGGQSSSSSHPRRAESDSPFTSSDRGYRPVSFQQNKETEKSRERMKKSLSFYLFLFRFSTETEDNEQKGNQNKNTKEGRYVSSEEGKEEETRLLRDTMDTSERTDAASEKTRECPLCFHRSPESQFPKLIGCDHRSCTTCLEQYISLEVLENRVEVSCPECTAKLHPSDVLNVLKPLGEDLMDKYEEFSLRRFLISEADARWCPAPDCGYAVIASSCAACPQLRCGRQSCGTLFCYHCKDVWHESETCDEARRHRGALMIPPSNGSTRGILRSSGPVRRGSTRMSNDTLMLKPGDIKACPRCRALIVKMDDGSCNHMVCTMCSTEFCWLCLKEISDLHYLSPTGCTFWGKKPWTKKKKLLWQLGTLIGAPLGIALIAGLSVPGIIFGVPVVVGRKVHHRFMHHSKLRRRAVTAACVAGSLVVSPVLAVMAVGVGVPIMLAYVYGVVPLSLCRNGGCGWGFANDEVSEDIVWTGTEGTRVAMTNETSEKSQLLSTSGVEGKRGGGDIVSIAPASSLHSGLSVYSTRAKSFADSESSNTKRVRRPSCESGGVTSLNYEEASTKAMAGSHYHYDDKSVHTLGSQTHELLSYCDDVASTKALAGSVLDNKSLSGSVAAHEGCDELNCQLCQGPSTSGTQTASTSHSSWQHRRSVGSTRQSRCLTISSSCRGAEYHNSHGDCREDEEEDGDGDVTPPASSLPSSSVPPPSSLLSSNPDPFRIRTLFDNMKQMVARDDNESDDEVYRPEPRTRHTDTSMTSRDSRVGDIEVGRCASPSDPLPNPSQPPLPSSNRKSKWLTSFWGKKK